jgi:hypothetical protein
MSKSEKSLKTKRNKNMADAPLPEEADVLAELMVSAKAHAQKFLDSFDLA